MPRERLQERLADIWSHRLTLVIAPAGSGKTTLLAQCVAAAGVPVAWYRAEPADATERAFLGYVERTLTDVLDGLDGGWESIDDAIAALDAWQGGRALLVIDDLHALQGTAAEQALARLVEYATPPLTVLAASRYPPALNLSRLRLTGQVLELEEDDLRFRSWEVEQLFRDFYAEPLPPADLAALARRTEGWAAGLQLFHLATRGKRQDERRRTLQALGARWRLVQEYLTDNVLGQLTPEVRDFLVETCVLGRLSGRLCDDLLDRTGSEAVLEDLVRSGIFTVAVEPGWYRYHEVLRSHLEAVLVERVGEPAARARYALAGRLLEASGELAEALCAYSRAEDQEAVARLLGHEGAEIASGPGGWLDRLPPAILQHDPWLLLARARRERADGRWEAALQAYRSAERAFGTTAAGHACGAERRALSDWLEPTLVRRTNLSGVLRAAVTRDPNGARAAAAALDGTEGRFAEACILLLGGNVREARLLAADAASAPEASALLIVAARITAGVAALLAGDSGAGLDVEWCAEEADRLGVPWLARVARAALALSDRVDGTASAEAVRVASARHGDGWGAGVAALLEGIGRLRDGSASPALLEEAAARFARLGAGTLEAWCRGVAALAQARPGDVVARRKADEALTAARTTGVPAAELFARAALAIVDRPRAAEHRSAALRITETCGIVVPQIAVDRADPRPPPPPAASVRLRCFGGFRLEIEGQEVDVGVLKPRARALLRLLAIHAGRPVHRERILSALWPEADPDSGTANLHVTLSALRHLLEPEAGRGEWRLVVRDGDAYMLQLPDDADVDVWVFEHAIVAGRRAQAAGDTRRAIASFERALWLHESELLPEDGPADWAVAQRERMRAETAEVAKALVELLILIGDRSAAVLACERGLHVDRYQDALWRMLIAIHEENGDRAAAERVRRRYEEVLEDLGIA